MEKGKLEVQNHQWWAFGKADTKVRDKEKAGHDMLQRNLTTNRHYFINKT